MPELGKACLVHVAWQLSMPPALVLLTQDDAVSCLVIGTESSQVLVLTPTANQATHIWQLTHVPAFICVSGQLAIGKLGHTYASEEGWKGGGGGT